jgi:hypothetical protein
MNLSRSIYIPAIIAFLLGVWLLCHGDAVNAAIIGMFGTLVALIGFLAAVREAGLIKLPKAS